MQAELNQEERAERVELLRARISRLATVHTQIRKLNAALANLALAEPKKQLSLIASAQRYVSAIEPVQGLGPSLRTISNELQSLREGISAKVVRPNDLVLLSGVRVLKDVEASVRKTVDNVNKLTSAQGVDDQNEALLRRTRSMKDKIPPFNGREFVIGRAPVAFTFANKQKHSSVGFVNQELLTNQGFKVDNLGGYTVIHNQLVVGIDAHAVYDKHTDEDGKKQLVRQRVMDKAVTFKGGKPLTVKKARDKSHFDVAKRIIKMMERQYNTRFAVVNEYAVTFNGGEFFWVVPAADMVRLARAFPGGHVKIDKWGFAF